MGLSLLLNKYVLMAAAIGAMFLYWQWTQTEMKTLKANNAILESSITKQQNAIKQLKADAIKIRKANVEMNTATAFQEAKIAGLNKQLTEAKSGKARDLEKMANRHPAMLSRIFNRGSRFRVRCLEIISGAPILPKEHEATGKARNNLCRELFNYEK